MNKSSSETAHGSSDPNLWSASKSKFDRRSKHRSRRSQSPIDKNRVKRRCKSRSRHSRSTCKPNQALSRDTSPSGFSRRLSDCSVSSITYISEVRSSVKKPKNESSDTVKSYVLSVTIPKYFEEESSLRETTKSIISEYILNPQSHPQHDKEWIKFATTKCQKIPSQTDTDLNYRLDEEWKNVWSEIIKEKYEKVFENECRSLLLKYDIDFADVEKYRKEKTSNINEVTNDVCFDNGKKGAKVSETALNDAEGGRRRSKVEGHETAVSDSKEKDTKDDISLKLRKAYHDSGKTVSENEISKYTHEIYDRNRELFEKNNASVLKNKILEHSALDSTVQLHEIFNLSPEHAQLLKEPCKQIEDSKPENKTVGEEVDWNNISNAIESINAASETPKAAWKDIGPIF